MNLTGKQKNGMINGTQGTGDDSGTHEEIRAKKRTHEKTFYTSNQRWRINEIT